MDREQREALSEIIQRELEQTLEIMNAVRHGPSSDPKIEIADAVELLRRYVASHPPANAAVSPSDIMRFVDRPTTAICSENADGSESESQ
jgi:hypothetical protein